MHEVQLKFLEDENKRLQEKVITANQRHSASLRANQKMVSLLFERGAAYKTFSVQKFSNFGYQNK